MDWYLDRHDQLGELRREIGRYLTRHAVPDREAVEDAELVVSEAVGNALRHTAGPVWVSLSWAEEHPALTVYDVGSSLPVSGRHPTPTGPDEGDGDDLDDLGDLAESGRGSGIIELLAHDVVARLRHESGTVVSMRLAVSRRPTVSLDPPRRDSGLLPALDEASPTGGFGRESFLRALVVQMSRAVEHHHGPDAAEAAVAQVGIDVGGQMEAEFRLAEGVVDRLTPEELGRCYVRLKHAIDGGFSVVEASAERVVLVNTRCPFGDTVRQAPALCRMTSSVFGGIAARNHDVGASVLLEERIAVGDPGCRVVVHLGHAPADVEPFAHHYATPSGAAAR
ncbi:methanogen output domain 1-containing protein [Arthrobacter sp. NEB 688]|uniref:methanogen output domain 1-containing protein n=1 Tax=Arthrobacter sp. NEB 688 TaxID=904039 RepID=UPI00156725B5|nr:methanogen output domain 1-containing protein [Arthrobacter sp. NEB 688]QKE83744.1 ATP-binding protein [Arthrobacter sp. NEB 688]